jgi:hypothetical protein
MQQIVEGFFQGGIVRSEWKRVPHGSRHTPKMSLSCGSDRVGCTTTPSNNCCSASQVGCGEE